MQIKKIFTFFIFIFGFVLVSQTVFAGTCNPDDGYNKCYYSCHEYYEAEACAYIQANSEIQSNTEYNSGGVKYVIGDAWFDYKVTGDEFYVCENRDSWDWIWDNYKTKCDMVRNEGSGETRPTFSGEYKVVDDVGDRYTKCPVFIAYDFDYQDPCGSYSYCYTSKAHGWGWASGGNCKDVRSVECYKDKDCSSNEYCDKSGNWDEWNCRIKECDEGEKRCKENSVYTCEDYKWKEEKDCNQDDGLYGDEFCKNDDVYRTYRDYYCSDGGCQYDEEDELQEQCGSGETCSNGECIEIGEPSPTKPTLEELWDNISDFLSDLF